MAKISLKPLSRDDTRKAPGFAVLDLESSAGWINFLVGGVFHKVYDELDREVSQHYYTFKTIADGVDYLFSSEQPYNDVFAHYGGGYDFSFFLKEFFFDAEKYRIGTIIPRGSRLLCFEVSLIEVLDHIPSKCNPDKDLFGKTKDGRYLIRGRTLTFRDSSAILPFSLASLTENFKVEHKKGEIDYDQIKEITPELLAYLESDCKGLYECIEKYFRWPIIKQAGPAFTVASQSIKVLRTYLKSPIPSLSKSVDAFVRYSYFGGRTEIFKPFFQQHTDSGMLKSYDVNSLYPFIMRSLDFPGGLKYETKFYQENELGFYDCEVEVPEMYIPPLGARCELLGSKLIFPTGRFRGVFSTLEINYALSVGAKIHKIFNGMVFHNIGPIFREFIDDFYAIRKRSAKDSVDSIISKLLMNAGYGRCGLNLIREQLVLDQGQIGVTPIDFEIKGPNNKIIRLAKEVKELTSSFSNVAIAAWVTSGARVHMHKLFQLAPEELYYCDTDSAKTTFTYPRNDHDLGELKLEYRSRLACYILPKTYLEDTMSPIFKLFDDKGKVKEGKTSKKIVMKGFDKRKISKFTEDDFKSALEGDMKRLRAMNPEKFAPLRSAIKKNEFLALLKESPRQIRTRYNKRKIVRRAYAQVYDTEPLHLKNGEITNIDKRILKKWKEPTSEDLDKAMEEVISLWK